MKYERFEDLPVWQVASDLAVRVFALGEKAALRRRSAREKVEQASACLGLIWSLHEQKSKQAEACST